MIGLIIQTVVRIAIDYAKMRVRNPKLIMQYTKRVEALKAMRGKGESQLKRLVIEREEKHRVQYFYQEKVKNWTKTINFNEKNLEKEITRLETRIKDLENINGKDFILKELKRVFKNIIRADILNITGLSGVYWFYQDYLSGLDEAKFNILWGSWFYLLPKPIRYIYKIKVASMREETFNIYTYNIERKQREGSDIMKGSSNKKRDDDEITKKTAENTGKIMEKARPEVLKIQNKEHLLEYVRTLKDLAKDKNLKKWANKEISKLRAEFRNKLYKAIQIRNKELITMYAELYKECGGVWILFFPISYGEGNWKWEGSNFKSLPWKYNMQTGALQTHFTSEFEGATGLSKQYNFQLNPEIIEEIVYVICEITAGHSLIKNKVAGIRTLANGKKVPVFEMTGFLSTRKIN